MCSTLHASPVCTSWHGTQRYINFAVFWKAVYYRRYFSNLRLSTTAYSVDLRAEAAVLGHIFTAQPAANRDIF